MKERIRDLYAGAVSGFVFPLHERLKGHSSTRVLRKLELTQWLERAALNDLRLARLERLLEHAGTRVPYYRGLVLDHDLPFRGLQSLGDLAHWPLLTKQIIREQLERLKSENAGKLMRFNTGGSTGEPLVFFLGRDRVSHDVAAKRRATRWWGVDIGDPEIVLWGSPIELGSQDRLRAFRDRILRSRLLPAFNMSEQRLAQFTATVLKLRPRMLFGYPSALALLARYAEGAGVDFSRCGIRVAFVTGERLYEEQREDIQRVFGCPVANGYGGRDAGFVAHECPAGGMHLSAEDIIVEIVDGTGRLVAPGEPGEIVVTHLATRAFPFIRYRTGDIGTLDDLPCSCGRGLPLLKEIQGRSTDFVVAADGTIMHGLALIYVVRDLPGVRAFKIIQESRRRIRVLIVPGTGFAEKSRGRIIRGFRERLGPMVEVLVETIPEIAGEKSGKFRYVVSHAPEAASTGARAPMAVGAGSRGGA